MEPWTDGTSFRAAFNAEVPLVPSALNAAVSFLNLKKKYMSLQVSILTPEKPFWNGEAEEIILPTETGEMGILKNHAPIVTGLDVGAMLIKTKEEWSSVAIMGGFALVKKNKVTVLANEAQAAESIDPEEAKTAFETAKNNLEKAAGVKEKVEANFAYKRAKARYQVVKVVKKL
jgi:F-type H+-transporting ATPase subunit epsilon